MDRHVPSNERRAGDIPRGRRGSGRAAGPAALLLAAAALATPASPAAAGDGEAADAGDLAERVSRLERALEGRDREVSVERGARLYARACAACHGRTGEADAAISGQLDPAPRNFRNGEYRFRTTASGELPRPEDIERTIRRGLPGSAMPGFGDLFSPRERADLVAFLMSLLPESRRERGPGPAVALPELPPAGPGAAVRGRGLYLALECWSCHGLEGDGRGPSARDFTDDSGRTIRPTDFRYDPFKGGREPADVVRALVTGLNGTPMPAYGDTLVFSREDMGEAAAFGGRLPPAAVAELDAFFRTLPPASEIAAAPPGRLDRIRDERLADLARYVLSLDRRGGFWSGLLRQDPEREPRRAAER